jgi:hypothetical protein
LALEGITPVGVEVLSMGRRKLLVALLAAAAVLPVASPSAPAGSIPQLAGTTVVSGTHTGVMKVRLPRPVEVSTFAFDNKAVDLDVSGSLGGLVLKQDVPKNGLELMAFSFSACKSCTGRAEFFDVFAPARRSFPKKETLPAGDYWLYVVADSAPTTVTLNLDGLGGTTELRPRGEATSRIGPADDIFVSPSSNIKAADHRQYVGRAGINLLAVDTKSGRSLLTDINQCLSRRKMSPAEALLGNACEGSGGSMTTYGTIDEKNRSVYISVDQSGSGRFWNTMSWRSAGDLREGGVIGFSLAYPDSTRTGGKGSGYFYFH